MTQEDKELLLKDLCARLSYGVKVKTPYRDATFIGIVKRKGYVKDKDYIGVVTDRGTYPIRYIQPYLRPMSSITKEEMVEFEWCNGECDKMPTFCYIPVEHYRLFDWLNRNHFDYRGLIEKGLAIEATEEIYKLK